MGNMERKSRSFSTCIDLTFTLFSQVLLTSNASNNSPLTANTSGRGLGEELEVGILTALNPVSLNIFTNSRSALLPTSLFMDPELLGNI
jgi:hypothetical protein